MERKEELNEILFGRVRNRIDLIGKVVKINGNFVCLDIPQFKGNMEYPIDLIEFINGENPFDERPNGA
ncbi:MAG TPA: hypothetical protein ENG74_02180 [Thermoplasmatales archaeon]|nr:hypothetical protein [Thermoplasmatales archaeon]